MNRRTLRILFWVAGLIGWALTLSSVVHAQNQITTGSVGPRGYTGPRGPAGTFQLGTVTTGDPGTDVIVNNVGSQSEAVLNMTIPRGSVIYHGDGAPASSLGGNSDWYIDNVAHCLYGPKASGVWPGTCQPFAGSVGPQGPQGPQGDVGPQGPPGSPSAGTLYDVQATDGASGFTADTTGHRIKIDPTKHQLVSNINDRINSQLYLSSNDGMANALSSADCTTGTNCYIYVGPNYTGTEYIPFVTSGTGSKVIDSYRGNSHTRWRYNPVAPIYPNGILPYQGCYNGAPGDCDVVYSTTPDNTLSTIPANYSNHAWTIINKIWGWSFGNSPGNKSGGWSTAKGITIADQFDAPGITQSLGFFSIKHANGDFALIYGYGYTDGGANAYSDEGQAGMTLETGETSDFFKGTVATGATTGTTTLPALGINGIRNTTTAGSSIINITKVWNSGNPVNITGATTTVYPNATGNPAVYLVPIDVPVRQSGAWGRVKCEQDTSSSDQMIRDGDMLTKTPGNPNVASTAHCTVTVDGGATSTGFKNGFAILGGDFPENVTIANVSALSGGIQTMDITYKNPHGGELALPLGHAPIYPGSYTTLWQEQYQGDGSRYSDDVTGDFISFDKFSAISTLTGGKTIAKIVGATDTSHVAISIGDANGAGVPNPFENPIHVDSSTNSITQNGTTVTASLTTNTDEYKFNKLSSIRVAGCSSTAGINGTGTNVSVDYSTQTISWTTSAASTGSVTNICGGRNGDYVTIDMPATEYQAHIYPGASVLGPSTAISTSSPTTIPLEPNEVAWTSGDSLEEPHHIMFSGEQLQLVHTIHNPEPGKPRTQGVVNDVYGTGVSSTYRPYRSDILTPCNKYRGCGGTLEPVPYMDFSGGGSTTGPNAGLAQLSSQPLNNAPVFTVGCLPSELGGCNNQQPLTWLANGYGTVGRAYSFFVYYPDNNEYGAQNLSAGFPYGVKGVSGVHNSATRYNGIIRAGRIQLNGTEDFNSGNSSVLFSRDGVNIQSQLGICHHNEGGNYITLGICEFGANNAYTDGNLRLANLSAQQSVTAGTITASLPTPKYLGGGVYGSAAYSGAVGTHSYAYSIYYVSPLGLRSPISGHTNNILTAATLGGGNSVTITCPQTAGIPAVIPSGTTVEVWRQLDTTTQQTNIGTCPINGTLLDDGSKTTLEYIPNRNASMPILAGQVQVNQGGVAFLPNDGNSNSGSFDTFITREGVKTLRIGGTASTADGTLHLDTVNVTTVNATTLNGAVATSQLTGNLDATKLTGAVPSASLTSVPAASLTGAVPPASLTSVPAASLTGAVPPASLTSVPAASLTGSVPSASLTSVPAANVTGTLPVGTVPVDNSTIQSNGSALTTKGWSGTFKTADTTPLTCTVSNGVITGCV